MPLNFRGQALQAPAQVLLCALAVTAVLLGCLLLFIMTRRAVRRRYFRRRDSRALYIRQNWDKIAKGAMPSRECFSLRLDRELIEEMALDLLETAEKPEADTLKALFRNSGLLDRRIREAARVACTGPNAAAGSSPRIVGSLEGFR